MAAGGDAWFDLPKVSRDGRHVLFRAKIESANPTAVSPDGHWLALMSPLDRDQDVWVMRTDGRDLRRVTDDVWRNWTPR